ncbi:Transcriptional regulatory protein moc3 [Colletotrichum fructicola]|uniref:Transcriptional regulatory protein moc3 n=1 Tax=Colletotrichum fructicola (strain Nara gc5) TaxID=1213859 RepID=A0A7J6IM82_COLFN|nr:uncharacterized protein CGMCC3_g16131 [Colletotrichum fructicola]KAF4476875.1 Transcriptional regulatory protein moc3 [Colletotrichum fructicola Nara gc5]KAE9567697.1 hypothetical protein CGMCC3_g16131 [Colletotrichum fructicola]KAF4424423.1 Transcriptional regulatory protein moc3 [Colletotrichum fructicola]KAF4886729.1 Transcriptional regulatory protein moc3 [Colletotrichum fructicola]KAF4897534.1 Transcriptional regulatory protein moc3 [Colletotrichum fructicola]
MKTIKFKITTGPRVASQKQRKPEVIEQCPRRRRSSAASPTRSTGSSSSSSSSAENGPKNHRSRAGCTECKRRRVKCDETFPVCRNCQRRGQVCEAAPRLRTWQMESPWIAKSHLRNDAPDKVLLRYWLEKASQIMVIDPDINPLSFPILEHLDASPSLLHALQSVSAAHQHFFDPSQMARCLEERGIAIQLVQREIANPPKDVFPVFLTVLMLGLSTAWIEGPVTQFGLQHLYGARALVDIMLADSSLPEDNPSVFSFTIGAYLYWDMATAFLVPSSEQAPIDNVDLFLGVLQTGSDYHPIGGYCTEVYYHLSSVGRYCRRVCDTGLRNVEEENHLENMLIGWKPEGDNEALVTIGEAFKIHGLINLAISKRHALLADPSDMDDILSTQHIDPTLLMATILTPPPGSSTEFKTEEDPSVREEKIRKLAVQVVRSLTSIPPTHSCTNLQAIPLLTAGSELTAEDYEEREMVSQRFRALYSINHIRSNLRALDLLLELWELRDAGTVMSWLDLMLEKGWSIMMG